MKRACALLLLVLLAPAVNAAMVTGEGATVGSTRVDFPWGPVETAFIRPGVATIKDDAAHCTLGFLLEDPNATTRYATTSGHCHKTIDEVVSVRNGTRTVAIGRVVALHGNHKEPEYAIIRLDDAMIMHANPTVLGTRGGPHGLATIADATPGSAVWVYGNGTGTGQSSPERDGELIRVQRYEVSTLATSGGDSGGPVLLEKDGAQLALAVHYGYAWDNEGPTASIPRDQAGWLLSVILEEAAKEPDRIHAKLALARP